MKNWRSAFVLAVACACMLAFSAPVFAASILWYSGGVEEFTDGDYRADVAAAVGGGVTFWEGGAKPAGAFDVLVVASPQGFWTRNPNYTSLNAAFASGSLTFGDRRMLTGQDADWHDTNRPGDASFNGPRGFLFDSVLWAAGSSGGMGLVALGQTGRGDCFGGAFLGMSGFTTAGCASLENVIIPTAFASFPINTGLTSAGLSNWGNSDHVQFSNLDPTKWTGINRNGNAGCGATGPCNNFVTIVTNGGGGELAPEPSSVALLGTGLLSLIGFARRRLS